MKRILFICKKRLTSHGLRYVEASSGLNVSAQMVVDMLANNGIPARLVNVTDNNDIDREVYNFKPDIVIIEAIWVIPEKFTILSKLHPKVQWIIRIHSEIPFLSNDGAALQWIYEYLQHPNIRIAVNSTRATRDLENLLKTKVLYLPNYYPVNPYSHTPAKTDSKVLNIGCFGAIRSFKNQLTQAIASIEFARYLDKPLRFHVNGSRIEDMGNSNLKNLIYLFQHNYPHKMTVHEWLDHEDFIKLVRKMDMILQVSFTESFNITSADAVSQDVPIVVSPEISWASSFATSPSCDVTDIVYTMKRVWRNKSVMFEQLNKIKLYRNMKAAQKVWLKWLRS